MRVNWNYIKTIFILLLVVFLYAFSSVKNGSRKIADLSINFQGDENLFITQEAVNKLLIQNDQSVTSMAKEILDLNGLEASLNSNAMIKNAQVYLTVNGEVRADIEQRKPIARVSTNASYYIDDEGVYMPLSGNYTARVPLVTGHIEKNKLENVFKVATRINQDQFLKTHITEIFQGPNDKIELSIRIWDFKILVGETENLDRKFKNLKAFYQKAKKDKTLDMYSKVNLQIENQVVCTKK